MEDGTISRAALLAELGYSHPEALARATALLAEAGVINPSRDGMSAQKRARCSELLASNLIRLCDGCATSHTGQRERVPVADRTQCERCAGSANHAAIQCAAEAFQRAGYRRLAVVGGSPGVHQELKRLWPLELRIIDGTERHTRREARAHLEWADAVVVWGSSELNHKVSEHYMRAPQPLRRKVGVVPRRGIEALATWLAARR